MPPEPYITGPATRVMSLRDGTKKMSKSDPSDLSRLNLTDDADTIARKIRKAKTDAEPLPTEAEGLKGRPEADNLTGIYAALSGESVEKVLAQYGGGQFSVFKNALADLAVAKLGPVGEETKRLQARPRLCRKRAEGRLRPRPGHRRADRAARPGRSWVSSSPDPRRGLSAFEQFEMVLNWDYINPDQRNRTCSSRPKRRPTLPP